MLLLLAVCSIGLVLTVTAKQPLQADAIMIGYQHHIYTEPNIDKQTIEALVEAYEDLPKTQKIEATIDWDTAVTVTYIDDDQISATVVIDARGVFQTKDGVSTTEYDDDARAFYMRALQLFEAVHRGDETFICDAC